MKEPLSISRCPVLLRLCYARFCTLHISANQWGFPPASGMGIHVIRKLQLVVHSPNFLPAAFPPHGFRCLSKHRLHDPRFAGLPSSVASRRSSSLGRGPRLFDTPLRQKRTGRRAFKRNRFLKKKAFVPQNLRCSFSTMS